MKNFKSIIEDIKFYFFELGNELSELTANIYNKITTKKWMIGITCVVLFVIGCFVWKPLFLLTITGMFMLMATIALLSVPCIITYIFFHLSSINDSPKYPVLNETFSIICSIIAFGITVYMAYDIAIRDLWYQPELWKEILNL